MFVDPTSMELGKVVILAEVLIIKHPELDHWKFELDGGKRRFGMCDHNFRTIRLSRHMAKLNDEDNVKDTLLHEIAHALVGSKAGHGPIWKAKCIEIGCRPKRCYSTSDGVKEVQGKFVYRCPGANCHREIRHHRQLRRMYACNRCCKKYNNGKFTEQYRLYLTRTE